MPNGVILRGYVTCNTTDWSGKTLALLLPEEETHAAKKDDRLLLGIVNQNICITVTKAEHPPM